jgi:hypothetical protein
MLLGVLILPGFIYGAVLVCAAQGVKSWSRVLFVLLSGGLYILCSWFASDTHTAGFNWSYFVLASVFGACGLFVLYFVLLKHSLIFWKGLLYSVMLGSITSVLPGIAYTKGIVESDTDFFPYDIGITMSIFLTWQTLFGAMLVLCGSNGTLKRTFAKKRQ